MATSMTRKEMQEILEAGGSVLHGRQIITDPAHLPSAADLAKGDPAAEATATADLKAQLAEVQRQLAELKPAAPTAPSGNAPPADKDGK